MTETPARTKSVLVRVVGSLIAGVLALFSLGLLSRVLYYGFRPGGIHEAVKPFLTYGFLLFVLVHLLVTVILSASWGLRSWVSRIAFGLAIVLTIAGAIAMMRA